MQQNNPLHGFTLQRILELLVEDAGGFAPLALAVPIKCFSQNPSIKSSLTFLRKTDWARQQVEALFVEQQLHRDVAERTCKPLALTTDFRPALKPAPNPAQKAAQAERKPQADKAANQKPAQQQTSRKPQAKSSQEPKPAPTSNSVWTGWPSIKK